MKVKVSDLQPHFPKLTSPSMKMEKKLLQFSFTAIINHLQTFIFCLKFTLLQINNKKNSDVDLFLSFCI